MWLTLLSPLLSGAVEPAEEDSETHAWSYFCYSGADGFQASSKNYQFQTLPQPDSFAGTARRALQDREAEATVEEASSGEPQQEAASSAVPVVDDGAARLGDMQGTCFFMRVGYWTYEVCPFGQAKQKGSDGGSTSLGNWEGFDQGHSVMKFTHGQHCWNGPARSLTVTMRCGGADAVLKVEEPEVCVYAMDMESPAACTDDDLRRARDDLALFGA